MKRNLGILAVLAAIGTAGYLGTTVWAQVPAAGQPGGVAPMSPPKTRIALVNLLAVVKKYQKCVSYEQSLRKYFQDQEARFTDKQKQLQQMKAEMDNPQTPPEKRAALEKNLKQVTREMQDMDEEIKQGLNKSRSETAVIIYREVQDAITRYARSNDIELVMHYNDSPEATDIYNPLNVQRKMTAGGCTPIYSRPGIDITDQIIQTLNAHYAQAAPAAGTRPSGN